MLRARTGVISVRNFPDAITVAVTAVFLLPAAAQEPVRVAPANQISIPDVPLLNEQGRTIRFRELLSAPVVVVNFIFTTCTTICLPLGANFASLGRELGSRAGTDVQLISVSVDPATDTPQRLRTWAAQFRPGPGWSLVTGSKPNVDALLRGLRVYTADKVSHTPMILIGRPATGEWIRTNGLAKPAVLAQIVNDVRNGRIPEGQRDRP